MRAVICDMCERVINDADEKNRKESNFEVHIVRVEYEPEEVENRKHFDLCWKCTQNIAKVMRDPAAFHRFMMKEGY